MAMALVASVKPPTPLPWPPAGASPRGRTSGRVGRAQAHRAEHGTGWATKTGATATEEVAYASNMTLRSEGNARYVTKHIYAGTQRLASKMDARWFAEDNVQYYATDHLGSTNFTLDSDQRVVSHTEYFPSGEIWRSETAPAYQGLNPYSFTGKEWDAITGLYDFGARQYDPRLGQWLSPDPAFDGLNLYAYVHNNPMNFVDPLGLFSYDAAKERWVADPGESLEGISEQTGIHINRLTQDNEGLSGQTLTGGEELNFGDYDPFDLTRDDVLNNQADAADLAARRAEALPHTDEYGIFHPGTEALQDSVNFDDLVPGVGPMKLGVRGSRIARAAQAANRGATVVFKTTKEAAKAAKKMGFEKAKGAPFKSHGEATFKKGTTWITPDNTGHRGGAWKMFDAKGNRIGTFNADLSEKVGP